MTPERRAVVGLLALALAGQGVRLLLLPAGAPPGAVRLPGSRPPAAAAARRDSLARLARPLSADERIDLDRATPAEIARLPGVGMTLAKRIVADREARGPFGGLAGLDRVAGVGPGLLGRIAPHAAFGGRTGETSGPPAAPAAIGAGAPADGRAAVLAVLNQGDLAALDRLPGIGPSRAREILAFRDSAGPIRGEGDLSRVPGLPQGLARRLLARDLP